MGGWRRGSDDGWKKKMASFVARSLEEKPEGC